MEEHLTNQPTQDRETDHIADIGKLVPAPTISGGAGSLNYLLDKFLEKNFQAMGRYNQHEKIESNEIRQAIITHAREVAGEFAEWCAERYTYSKLRKLWFVREDFIGELFDYRRVTTSELYSLYLTFKNKKA